MKSGINLYLCFCMALLALGFSLPYSSLFFFSYLAVTTLFLLRNIPLQVQPLGDFFEIQSYLLRSEKWIVQKRRTAPFHCITAVKAMVKQSKDFATMLPKGRYMVVTHALVLHRIEDDTSLILHTAKPIKPRSLQTNAQALRGCSACDKKQGCHVILPQETGFYRVGFEKV